MPFTSYTEIGDVAHAHNIQLRRASFVKPAPAPFSEYFRSEIVFNLNEVPYDSTESAACETLIYPLLREAWKPFRDALTIWSRPTITYDSDLCGMPDFLVARRSPLGHLVFDIPYFLVVEAKRDDFVRGWGQCLAAMVAVQKLNGLLDPTLYGVATNGLAWQFGRLEKNVFTQESEPFTVQRLDDLADALNYVLLECRGQAVRPPSAA
jgi:hypothetical protein